MVNQRFIRSVNPGWVQFTFQVLIDFMELAVPKLVSDHLVRLFLLRNRGLRAPSNSSRDGKSSYCACEGLEEASAGHDNGA